MAKKISVIIPNYNGRDLLAKNLPLVIKTCYRCEIIVVDDKSTDESVKFLRHNFKNIKIVENKRNQGFAGAVNAGVENAKGDLVLLLNSDVAPRLNFLTKASSHFKKIENKKLFAVGLCDISHETGKIVKRGRGTARFTRGFFSHSAAQVKAGKTLWVSGGSGLFNKKKFLELGGFDSIFAPFYWEDLDLCYRAWKAGFFCVFEPDSQVDHYHEEGAIKKSRSQFYIKKVSYKNQFLFVWKNIDDYFLIALHFLWMPYHFIEAFLSFNTAFFIGLLWAILEIPSLIFNGLSLIYYQLSDREVLKKFEGQ